MNSGMSRQKPNSEKPSLMAKVIVLGNSAVGKTSLLTRYTWDGEGPYTLSHTPTIGVDFKSAVVECEGKWVKLQLWDTAGQQRYRTLTDNYYSGASGIVLVYSVTDRKSFQEISEWMFQISSKASEDVPKIILANKCDVSERSNSVMQKRSVELYEGRVLASKYGCLFMEVSAKEDINVDAAFSMLTSAILKKNNDNLILEKPCNVLTLKHNKPKLIKKGCCG